MRTIKWKTNYNNKLDCDCFSHIDEAPPYAIKESEMRDIVFEIHTLDESHPPVKTTLINLLRIPLSAVTDHLSYPSHGMDADQYFDFVIQSKPKLHPAAEMAVYYYKRQKE